MLDMMSTKLTQKIKLVWALLLVGIELLLWANPVYGKAVDIGTTFGFGTIIGGTINQFATISQLVNPLVFTFYVFGGICSFISLLYGGFSYIMGAGQADQKRIEQGKQIMTWGIGGLVLLVSIYYLVQIIEIMTGIKILNPTI